MEFVLSWLAIIRSGVKSLTEGRSLWTRSRQAENARNSTIIRAKEPVIRRRFFFDSAACFIPREVSTLNSRVLAARRIFRVFSVFPDTAAMGETFAACFAGKCAARNTVMIPTAAPQRIPGILTEKRGIFVNSPFTKNRRITHNIQQLTTPSRQPSGTAVLHQFNASSLTNRMICFLLAPIQRSMPKNAVRWATLLFIQLAIIKIPAASMITKQRAARGYNPSVVLLLLAPNSARIAVFSFTFSSVRLYSCFKSPMVFLSPVSFWNRI